MAYDPHDTTYAEPVYTPGSEARPTFSVAIGVVVALFAMLLTFPHFSAIGILPQFAMPFVAGGALGAAAAWIRTKSLGGLSGQSH
jgi:hypothetical protein